MRISQDIQTLPPFFTDNDISPISQREKVILDLILRHDGLSQADLVLHSGLPQQTVSRLVKGLTDTGILRDGPRQAQRRRGQPATLMHVVPEFSYSFGIAMMTDALSVVLMDFSGAVLEEEQCEMPSMSRPAVLAQLSRMFETIRTRRPIDNRRLLGIGVGISGYNLGGRAHYNTPRQLDDWAIVNIDDILTAQFGLPVWVENDGNAAAIGESLVGVGRSHASFAYLYIAAGIGGGIIVDHHLMRGVNGNAGEIGLILPSLIYPHPNLELLRQTVSRKGVVIDGLSDMLRRFDPSWPGVDEWLSCTRDSLSLIASALSAILDPEVIVLGGRIPRDLARMMIPHIEIHDHRRRAEPRPMPQLVLAESPGDACAIGAATLPFKRYFFTG
ncbi:NagC family transcriptional regulator [Iodidimonas gelatinilytica]|uniref:NagC family transcriptional regulator n=1 Tax=Iodidimonas gelatinilytica TaxID=1236966 RepID=A0A5A7MP14_9PROT|nr:ROK family transcriptional regulator [Iodidimonas gelatinilytica]GEQ97384.1 NagC family transcriptional regulator [Iodidimonas gelatinilytica]GER02019.1 NagC family transcriptional regulator [Iodidimonas gelatinilytica]